MRLATRLTTVALATLLSGTALAVSEREACDSLIRAAVEYCLSRTDLSGQYYCDPLPDNPSYFLLGLRAKLPSERREASNLVGWFAVSRSDGAVFGWSVSEDQAAPLVSRCPFESE